MLRRDRKLLTRRDEVLDYVHFIPLDDGVLSEAEAILPHIRTLDAIHLASVIRSGLDVTVATHDATMRSVAEVIGYPVIDPINAYQP